MQLRASSFLAVILALAVGAGAARAAIVDYYEFPFVNPLEATVIGTPSIYQADLPAVPIEPRELFPFPGRQVPDLFWYAVPLQYALARQPGPAPLVFVLPGTGAGPESPRTMILIQTLYKAGFHVASLPSTLHPNFIVSASTSRRPGLLAEDAEDIYRVMEQIRARLAGSLPITGYHLAGYSLGAAQAGFVAKLDEERRSFGLQRVLMINPPVNLYRSANILDAMFEDHLGSPQQFNGFFNRIMSLFSRVYATTEAVNFSSDFFYEIYKRYPPEEATLEALIGLAFRFTSINLLFTADVMADTGLIVPRDYDPAPTAALTVYFKLASILSFADYARHIVHPYYYDGTFENSFDQLASRTSLNAIDGFLRRSRHIGLMHNVDDIILEEGDIDYLIDVFGERAQIYPKGGHCGNMAFKDNVAHVIDFFTTPAPH